MQLEINSGFYFHDLLKTWCNMITVSSRTLILWFEEQKDIYIWLDSVIFPAIHNTALPTINFTHRYSHNLVYYLGIYLVWKMHSYTTVYGKSCYFCMKISTKQLLMFINAYLFINKEREKKVEQFLLFTKMYNFNSNFVLSYWLFVLSPYRRTCDTWVMDRLMGKFVH